MNAPEKIPTNVYAKLQAARCQLQAISLKKSGHNKFAGYTYFELGDFLPTINQIFDRLGLCGIVSFTPAEATLRVIDTESGQETLFCCPLAEANLKGCHPVQNLGASITYTRRYLYTIAMEIVEHDALDATTGKGEKQSAKTQSDVSIPNNPRANAYDEMTAQQKAWLREIMEEAKGRYDSTGDIADAGEYIYDPATGLETETMAALWYLFSKAKTDDGKSFARALDKWREETRTMAVQA